jgi:ABC-type transporter Mla MlaB component
MTELTRAVSLAITGPIRRSDLDGLSLRVCGFFSRCIGSTVACDVSGVPADAVTVDALSRLQWVAKKYGCTVVLREAAPELRSLVALMGLSHVLVSG